MRSFSCIWKDIIWVLYELQGYFWDEPNIKSQNSNQNSSTPWYLTDLFNLGYWMSSCNNLCRHAIHRMDRNNCSDRDILLLIYIPFDSPYLITSFWPISCTLLDSWYLSLLWNESAEQKKCTAFLNSFFLIYNTSSPNFNNILLLI